MDDVVVEEADNDDFEELSIDDMVESATAEVDEIVDDSIFDDDEEIDLTAAEVPSLSRIRKWLKRKSRKLS